MGITTNCCATCFCRQWQRPALSKPSYGNLYLAPLPAMVETGSSAEIHSACIQDLVSSSCIFLQENMCMYIYRQFRFISIYHSNFRGVWKSVPGTPVVVTSVIFMRSFLSRAWHHTTGSTTSPAHAQHGYPQINWNCCFVLKPSNLNTSAEGFSTSASQYFCWAQSKKRMTMKLKSRAIFKNKFYE